MNLKVQRASALTLGAFSLLATMAVFATLTRASTLTSSPSIAHEPTTTTTTTSCIDDVQQQGEYSGHFGCEVGPDSSITDAGDGPELEP